ncbi:hypothetical protein HOE67_02150 [Candidatus Peregrinibacteria bacterium]|nr:hypothetical protein [Candidatus Peregrinibacteria bacterium]MBT4055891.1 hypothetical protein [Candidatus Peregrinibacteria bacterium]
MNFPRDPEIKPVKIPSDPRQFVHDEVRADLLVVIEAVIAGADNEHGWKRCSQFCFNDLFCMALGGRLFAGVDISDPELLAEKMTQYFWGEVCRGWNPPG